MHIEISNRDFQRGKLQAN